MSTDYFQNRPNTFENARRRLESPGERGRLASAVPRSERAETGSQPTAQPAVTTARSITWGTAFKISMAVYFALVGVLLTLAVVTLLLLRFVFDTASIRVQDFGIEWQSLSSVSQSSTVG